MRQVSNRRGLCVLTTRNYSNGQPLEYQSESPEVEIRERKGDGFSPPSALFSVEVGKVVR